MARYLILEDGTAYKGTGFGSLTISTGELAIQTANFGYQEAISDPANFGKILAFTTPMIGGSGINAIDYESIVPSIKGIVVNDLAPQSYFEGIDTYQSLDHFLSEKKIPGIYGIDVRSLVHKIKEHKTIKASIMDTDDNHAFDQIKALVLPKNKTAQISTSNAYAAPNVGKTVAVIDLGIKHSLLRALSLRKINCVVLPYNASINDINNIRPDGIIISNGPGKVEELINYINPIFDYFYKKLPILTIGLGYLLLSNYLGLELFDIFPPYNGSNFPVIDQNTHKIWQTSINLNSLVMPVDTKLSFSNIYYDLNSDLIAGYSLLQDKAIGVAFNPEGSPGTFDAKKIFDDFTMMME